MRFVHKTQGSHKATINVMEKVQINVKLCNYFTI